MTKVILSALMLLMIAHPARAKPVLLKGAAADAFLAERFPKAEIPGPVSGAFLYVNKAGRKAIGHAKCLVPAMGARSDGAVSACSVWY